MGARCDALCASVSKWQQRAVPSAKIVTFVPVLARDCASTAVLLANVSPGLRRQRRTCAGVESTFSGAADSDFHTVAARSELLSEGAGCRGTNRFEGQPTRQAPSATARVAPPISHAHWLRLILIKP